MSKVMEKLSQPVAMDPYEIGWWIESADEEIYGPVSRKTLRRFVEEEIITPNTLVRHSTQPDAKPAADHPGLMEGVNVAGKKWSASDRLAEKWPRRNRDRLALAEDALPCAYHNRQAILVCVRCQAPYCNRCRAKPFRKQFFFCRRCQSRMYNRRSGAMIVDNVVFWIVPRFAAGVLIGVVGVAAGLAMMYVFAGIGLILFMLRDSMFWGAGPGKRLFALRVVQIRNGESPLTYGQGLVRWLSYLIPVFNLVDLSVPFRDPLQRRFGDRWAGTRVIDTKTSLARVREKTTRRLLRKGVKPAGELGLSVQQFAQLV